MTMPLDALYDWDQMCKALAEQEPWWEPGTKHGYHVIIFGFLVGEVLRRITGQSLGEYFKENIADPLEADFHIGLPSQYDERTSDIFSFMAGNQPPPKPPETSEPPNQAILDMRDPATMIGAMMLNPPQTQGAVNTREWRAAEIPSINGHATATSIAKIYGALSKGGEIDGVRLLEQEIIERAITEESFGADTLAYGQPTRFGLGFALTNDFTLMGPGPRAFGHAGMGGSLGFAGPDKKIGFGYTMNHLTLGPVSESTAISLVNAFYDCL